MFTSLLQSVNSAATSFSWVLWKSLQKSLLKEYAFEWASIININVIIVVIIV